LPGFIPLFREDKPSRALSIFNRYHEGEGGHMLFIVDQQRKLRGTITRRDLLDAVTAEPTPTWEWVRQHPESLPGMPLGRIMKSGVAMVSPETSLNETAHLMLRHHYDSMPVVADGHVQGVVRLTDVLRYIQAIEKASMDKASQ
jgi:CBS domain-containing protein